VDAVDGVRQHGRIGDVPRRQHHAQRLSPTIGDEVEFAGQAAPRAADRVSRRLLREPCNSIQPPVMRAKCRTVLVLGVIVESIPA
jgi:hypothetical protein